MKGTIVSLFVFASMLLLSAVADAQTTNRPECTSAILNGSYGVLHDGVVFGEDEHLAEVAVATFDGKGHWTLDATLVRQGSGLGHTSARDATYTVNPDCTGSADFGGSKVTTRSGRVLVFSCGWGETERSDRPVRQLQCPGYGGLVLSVARSPSR